MTLWGVTGLGSGKRLGPGEVAAGLGQGGWLQALLLGARMLPACSILTKSWKQGSAPRLLPWGFCSLVSCFCLFSPCFPQQSSCSSAHSVCKPWGCHMLVSLSLACPQARAKSSCCCSDLGTPSLVLPQQHTSILFCLKHFNVMGQQLRGCPDPFLEALSTFRQEGRNSGLVTVSTLCYGLCVEAAGLTNLAEVSRARLCPALTLLPSTDRYN